MTSALAKRLRLLASIVTVLLLLVVVAGGWFYSRMRASLPQLDGEVKLAGLSAPVTVERDALGVPTIHGQNRVDLARALGFLHAQDRFFQMDVLRRAASGELSEVFGKVALGRDKAVRLHGFRSVARKVIEQASPAERAVVEAYTVGVNAGLGALKAKPFEYVALRMDPQPWKPEDSVLAAFAMWLDLQEPLGRYEQSLLTLRNQLGVDAVAFFAPLVGPHDAALDGTTAPLPPVPGPKMLDLRKTAAASTAMETDAYAHAKARAVAFATRAPAGMITVEQSVREAAEEIFDRFAPGSNAFALAGAHTASGAGLMANDMHLDHAVPNIWYRISLEYPDHRITGVTLPGTPLVVVGSNGHVAWGFTDAYADTSDLAIFNYSSLTDELYTVPGHQEMIPVEKRKETILVKGGDPVTMDYVWTIWGPVVGTSEKHPMAYSWIAHDPEATNFSLLAMEDAKTTADAVGVAHRAGIPAENCMIADSAGTVAWTIAGRIPKRLGLDGRMPANWSFGDRKWDGLLPPDEVPVLTSTKGDDGALKNDRLWSGNQRAVGGEMLAKIGDGGYHRPARAAQIRDDLKPLEHAAPKDLLAIQLDDRAVFLAPWQKLLLDTLTPAAVGERKVRGELRDLATKWEGHASVDSVSYRLVHDFRVAVYTRVFTPIFASCVDADEGFRLGDLKLEEACWALIREKPAHLLNPEFKSWDALLVAAAEDVVKGLAAQGVPLEHATWGQENAVQIHHPFSYSLPHALVSWLDYPAGPMPGDTDMPRVQGVGHGASERMVVSPGHEAEGIFHMPGGQSAHPLSPYFTAGHEAWMKGEPTAFLPGKTEHTLRFAP